MVLTRLRKSLISKLIVTVGFTLMLCIAFWTWFNVHFQERQVREAMVSEVERLSSTIRLGTHYAMMLDAREDIKETINNIARLDEIESIRVYNKRGEVVYSNLTTEVGSVTDIREKACYVCHVADPPLVATALVERLRETRSPTGARLMGIMSPIYNEPACSTAPCHVHSPDKRILGLLDVVVSLEEADETLLSFRSTNLLIAVLLFFATFAALFLFIHLFVNKPIRKLMAGTRRIANGQFVSKVHVDQDDEIGQLAESINKMGKEVTDKHAEINKQRDSYQALFEGVPCIITVQDRNYRLMSYNREFQEQFDPCEGDFCYRAYKGREEKCEDCPVEKTFDDGRSHYSEETGLDKDGSVKHWIVTTAPIRDESGQIVAAMEMCLDITPRKELEHRLEVSERKYHAIFNNIPSAVFVLDHETLQILDWNESVEQAYGYGRDELPRMSFLDLFREQDREAYAASLHQRASFNQVCHVTRGGRQIFVSLSCSPSELPGGRRTLLVAANDITKRLETEQQLIQAAKMATLGEMATGVAHELNQPLSVIRTISGFLARKLRRNQCPDEATLEELAGGLGEHVERAAKIIDHMREFGRKSDLTLERVRINDVLQKASEIFLQQLKLRNIEVEWDLDPDLPCIEAEPNRLEQVFINMLINARDAIEEAASQASVSGDPDQGADRGGPRPKCIRLRTWHEDGKGGKGRVLAQVCDTGAGIPVDILPRLFEPFFTTKEVGKGTGLGLSISYGIVQDYNGSILAANNEHGGACFTMSFPVAPCD